MEEGDLNFYNDDIQEIENNDLPPAIDFSLTHWKRDWRMKTVTKVMRTATDIMRLKQMILPLLVVPLLSCRWSTTSYCCPTSPLSEAEPEHVAIVRSRHLFLKGGGGMLLIVFLAIFCNKYDIFHHINSLLDTTHVSKCLAPSQSDIPQNQMMAVENYLNSFWKALNATIDKKDVPLVLKLIESPDYNCSLLSLHYANYFGVEAANFSGVIVPPLLTVIEEKKSCEKFNAALDALYNILWWWRNKLEINIVTENNMFDVISPLAEYDHRALSVLVEISESFPELAFEHGVPVILLKHLCSERLLESILIWGIKAACKANEDWRKAVGRWSGSISVLVKNSVHPPPSSRKKFISRTSTDVLGRVSGFASSQEMIRALPVVQQTLRTGRKRADLALAVPAALKLLPI